MISSAQSIGVTPDLAVTQLGKTYRGPVPVTVLHDITFTVPHGQAAALIGPNGSGKSTLLRCCLRLIEPTHGTVRLLGEELTAL